MKIWIAVVNHKHGHNVYAAESEDGIYEELCSYVRDNWGLMMPVGTQIPGHARDAVKAYFEYAAEHDFYEYIDYLEITEVAK